jgi:hypothetical protein
VAIDVLTKFHSELSQIRSVCIAFDGRVIAKEAQHFLSRVRPRGVGTGGTAVRPSVTSSMDAALL